MTVHDLQDLPSWQWPRTARATILRTLRDQTAGAEAREAAAHLAGDGVVINDELAGALLTVLDDALETTELRAAAAIALGPVLEQSEMDGFDDDGYAEPSITEATFHRIQTTLQRLQLSDAPKLLRRRALEAAVRAPLDWQHDATRAAYAASDSEWRQTAVFAMGFLGGFAEEIVAMLDSPDEDVHFEAVRAAGRQGLQSAWKRIAPLLAESTPKPLIFAAIEAAGGIGHAAAKSALLDLQDSGDAEIAEAAEEALVEFEPEEFVDDEEDEPGQPGYLQ